VTAGLFDALSNNSDIDHPLCEECTDSILELLDHQLRLTENEQTDYREYLQRFLNSQFTCLQNNATLAFFRLQDENPEESLGELETELEKVRAKLI